MAGEICVNRVRPLVMRDQALRESLVDLLEYESFPGREQQLVYAVLADLLDQPVHGDRKDRTKELAAVTEEKVIPQRMIPDLLAQGQGVFALAKVVAGRRAVKFEQTFPASLRAPDRRNVLH